MIDYRRLVVSGDAVPSVAEMNDFLRAIKALVEAITIFTGDYVAYEQGDPIPVYVALEALAPFKRRTDRAMGVDA